MSDLESENTASVPAEIPSEQLTPWLKRAPLLPEAGAAGTPLIAVIAVICFLACLALASFFTVSKASSEWMADLRGSITVQIKGQDSATIANETEAAIEFLQGTAGVVSARALSRDETSELLEPWLGSGNLPASVPIPGLIELEVTAETRPRLPMLASDLKTVAPGATLDDHSTWNETLSASARTAQIFAFFVFILIMGAVFTTIVFATKAGLAANKEIVDVLHLVGATDGFIAQEVQRRFVILGLRGAAIGMVIAAVAIALIGFFINQSSTTSYFLPSVTNGIGLYFWLLIVPLITCAISAWTARNTVLSTLSQRF